MRKSVGLLVCAAALVVGCGTVKGEAEPNLAIRESPFEPCDDIPGEVLRDLGFDPGTADRDIMGIKQPGRNICFWKGDVGHLDVEANLFGLDVVRQDPNFLDIHDIDLDGRRGLAFTYKGYREGENCYAVTETPSGVVSVSVTVDPRDHDACATAHTAAVAILPYAAR